MQEGFKENISSYVCDKFRLFDGLRTLEEDQEIYNKLLSHCLNETIMYLSLKLDANKRDEFMNEIKKIVKSDIDDISREINSIFSKYIEMIPRGNKSLEKIITKKIDLIYDKVLQKKQ